MPMIYKVTQQSIPTSRNLEEKGLTMPVKTVSAGAFILKERLHSPASNPPRHYHETSMLSFTTSYCVERNKGRTREYRPFDLQVALPGQIHSIQYGREGARTLNIEIEFARSELIQPLAAAARLSGWSKDARLARLPIRLYGEFQNLDSVSGLAIEGLVLETLARAARCSATGFKGQAPVWLGRARDQLHTRFNESLRLADLADVVGTHPVHLAVSARVVRSRS